MENELAEAYSSQNPQTDQMAAQGRKGDAMMAHVTPGDYVIPKDILVQHPDFLVKLKKVMADEHEDYRTHMVGSGFENINPETGAPEFGFGNFARGVGRVGLAVAIGGTSEVGGRNGLGARLTDSRDTGTAGAAGNVLTLGKGLPQFQAPPPMSSTPYSPAEMKLPGSLQEMGGLTDLQRRSYLATQGSQGEGLGGNARDYYTNLLQRNIQSGQDANLLPVESQFLHQGGINTNLSGQSLIDALRGF